MYKKVTLSSRPIYVYASWLLGLIIGMVIAFSSEALNARIQDGDIFMSISVFGIFFSSILPVLIFALPFIRRNYLFLYFYLAANGIILGYSRIFLRLLSPLGGWLIVFVYLISQSCATSVMLFLSAVQFQFSNNTMKRLFCICFSGVILVSFLHFAFMRYRI